MSEFNNKVIDRKKMLWCMEYLVRSCNNEELIDPWLALGVPDGDINLGTGWQDVPTDLTDDKDQIKEWMDLFLEIMSRAKKDGGLYVM